MWGLMWALKNSSLVSMSTMYVNFDRRKTHLVGIEEQFPGVDVYDVR